MKVLSTDLHHNQEEIKWRLLLQWSYFQHNPNFPDSERERIDEVVWAGRGGTKVCAFLESSLLEKLTLPGRQPQRRHPLSK